MGHGRPIVNTPEESTESIVARAINLIATNWDKQSPAEALADMSKAERNAWLGSLNERELKVLEYTWDFWARPKQRFPKGDWKRHIVVAGRGFGKLLPLGTPVPTPSGWTTMGDLRVGDTIFDESGKPCRVTHKSPVTTPEKSYRLGFSDDTFIDACSEHQWVTWTHAERKAFLRSPYEDTKRFPENWPMWRLKRRNGGGPRLSRDTVENAIYMLANGVSERQMETFLDVSRATVRQHIRAGGYKPDHLPYIADAAPGPQIRTTQQIVDTLTFGKRRDTNHCIPQCGPLQLPEIELTVPPYLLGVWLGDGSKADGTITQHESDQPFLRSQFNSYGFECTDRTEPQNFGVLRFAPKLRELGVIHNKHVPTRYLRGSIEQRLALLQGLMDTDGGVEAASTVSFTNGIEQIADSVYELVVSLGMRATRDARWVKGATMLSHRVTFTPTMQVFRMPRKADCISTTCSQQLRRHHRMIVSADPIEPVPMQCITVDSPNSMYLAGREMIPTHNTRYGAEWVRHQIESGICRHIALVAADAKDLRRVIVEDARGGGSGLLQICPPWNMPHYSPSKMRLTWTNPNYKSYGASCLLYSAEKPDSLRGTAHDGAWLDEFAKWGRQRECWDMLQFGMRMGVNNPQTVITTTPKPCEMFLELLRMAGTIVTMGSTFENRANLSASFLKDILHEYEGTRMGRQELYAEILSDIVGALWNQKLIQDAFLPKNTELPILRTRVVGVDPQMSFTSASMTGIVVAGSSAAQRGMPIRGYILADRSTNGTPKEWAKAVVDAYHDYDCHWIIAERNQGGELVADNIHNIDMNVRVKLVTATKSKGERAIPVVSRYEQSRVLHYGVFPELESEMLSFVPGDEMNKKRSPNRLDAMVHALDHLLVGGQKAGAGISITRRI